MRTDQGGDNREKHFLKVQYTPYLSEEYSDREAIGYGQSV